MDIQAVIDLEKDLENIVNSSLTLTNYCKVNSIKKKELIDRINDLELFIAQNSDCSDEFMEHVKKVRRYYDSLTQEETSKYKVIYNRENNKIKTYSILIKNRQDVKLEISREDLETIFGLYTYYGGNITARNVANEFPKLTLAEVKKVIRAFNITKDSAWFPPHLNEEMSVEELCTYRMNLKERAAFKYADAMQERDFKNTLNQAASTINKLKDFNSQLGDILYNYKREAFDIPDYPVVTNDNSTLLLFLADMHIGAKVSDNAIFANRYDATVIKYRLDQIVKYLKNLEEVNTLVVVNVGDALDGMDEQTARRDHFLPQNMDNFEQINTYIKSMDYLFESLIKNKIANEYKFISVPCGNHDGSYGYAAAKLAAAVLEKSYGIYTYVNDSFFLRYDVDKFTYLICHGKDQKYMKNGYKINLDDNTELKINQYINNSVHSAMPNINVVSGDLHNESMNRGKQFKYYKVGSFFGSSEYCMYGWGNTPPHINFHVINGDMMLNGTIELK